MYWWVFMGLIYWLELVLIAYSGWVTLDFLIACIYLMRSRCQNIPGKMQNRSRRLEEIRVLQQIYHMWPAFPPHYYPQPVLHSLRQLKGHSLYIGEGGPESWESSLVGVLCRKGMKMEDAAIEMFSWFSVRSYSCRGQVSLPKWQKQCGYIYHNGGRNKLVISIFCLVDIFGSGKLMTVSLGMKYIDSLLKCYLIYKIIIFRLLETRRDLTQCLSPSFRA